MKRYHVGEIKLPCDDGCEGSPSHPISQYKVNKGNNKITELRTILQRESQNS